MEYSNTEGMWLPLLINVASISIRWEDCHLYLANRLSLFPSQCICFHKSNWHLGEAYMARNWGQPPANSLLKLRSSVQQPPGTESCQQVNELVSGSLLNQAFRWDPNPSWHFDCRFVRDFETEDLVKQCLDFRFTETEIICVVLKH